MKKYAIIALAGLTLASCKKQEGPVNPVTPEGKDATISLNITSAAPIGTYASTSESHDGTANEKVVKTIDVFLYNEDGSLSPAGYERFSGNDANLSTPKIIKTKSGPKRIYIGINLPLALANQLKDNYQAMQSPYAVNMAELATASDGLMMFNQGIASMEIKEGNHADNKISIPVARLLAKAGVMQHENLSMNTQGGTVSDLQYTIGQRNKNIFVGHLYDFKDANWTYISPTLSAAEYTAAFTKVLNTEYKAVDAKTVTTETLNTVYIPENTSEKSEHSQVTYVQVKTKFTPAVVEEGAALPGDGTFYVMFGQIGTDPYIHQLYFASKEKADEEAVKEKYKVIKNGQPVFQTAVLKYDKGLCYYRLYLNEDQVAGANKVGIFRNTFFKAQISKFKGLGTPLEGQVPGETGTPGNPGGGVTPIKPVDPEGPVNPGNLDANIEATITITPWTLITSEHEI
ncbi:Mfa1 family fimbria major subunit [Sphingobacterium spiritivorum]|uniref:Mfa1 family fimbria major subunit n=1 Tax=Sphingobacterium spiritivorum TaxID=258 RepID=UPI003DA4B47D